MPTALRIVLKRPAHRSHGVEIGNLATIAQSFGRRGDDVMAMWQHTQQKLRARKRVRPPSR